MRRTFVLCLSGVLGCLFLSSAAARAGSRNPADFPLRVHIFQFNGYSHYYSYGGTSRSLNAVDGEGRANLYENVQPRGFDFSYSCAHRLMVSPGFETYMARWKKPDRVLEILTPVLGGKPGDMDSCELKVSMKQDAVYVRHNGLLGEEPGTQFKKWMDAHQYDPEHGKNEPSDPAASQPAQGMPAPGRNGNSTNSQP